MWSALCTLTCAFATLSAVAEARTIDQYENNVIKFEGKGRFQRFINNLVCDDQRRAEMDPKEFAKIYKRFSTVGISIKELRKMFCCYSTTIGSDKVEESTNHAKAEKYEEELYPIFQKEFVFITQHFKYIFADAEIFVQFPHIIVNQEPNAPLVKELWKIVAPHSKEILSQLKQSKKV